MSQLPHPPSPALVDVSLRVPAMDCADEVALVRQALEHDPGIAHIAFDLVHARVSLAIDPGRTSIARIRAAIEGTGLAVTADGPAAPGTAARGWSVAGMADVLASGALLAVGWIVDGLGAHTWQEAVFGASGGDAAAHVHAPGAIAAYALAVAAGLWRMWPRALAAIRHLRLDMHVLVCLSAAGAAAIGQWAEAAAVAFLFAVAHRLEAWSLERARDALAAAGAENVAGAEGLQDAAPVERWIERFAAVYTPAVTIAAVVVAVGPPLVDGLWSQWFYRALVFLVMACPCALVISTPVTVVAAVTSLAREGVVVRGGAALELAASAMQPTADALARAGLRVVDGAANPAGAATAHVILMGGGDRARLVERLVAHARRAVAVIRQNVAVSLVTKGAFLASALLGSAPLWLAVLADTGATVVVTLNGLRLLGSAARR